MDDLDRLIDEAARRMAQREPPEALTSAVMARVALGARPSAQRRLVWGSIAAAAALGAVVMLVGVNRRVPSANVPLQAQSSVQGPGLTTQGSGLRAQGSGLKAQGAGLKAQGAGLTAVAIPDEMEPIEDPIVFESISPEPIEVEPIKVAVTSIESIQTFPIEIEPISKSND